MKAGRNSFLSDGNTYDSNRIAAVFELQANQSEAMLAPGKDNADSQVKAVAGIVLTQRELQVLRLISQGVRRRHIALRLYISVPTVRKHRENIMRKLDLHNVAELIAYAIKHDLYKV